MSMLAQRGGFIHQHRPDVIPHGYVTNEEIALWVAFYEERARAGK